MIDMKETMNDRRFLHGVLESQFCKGCPYKFGKPSCIGTECGEILFNIMNLVDNGVDPKDLECPECGYRF